MTEFHELLQQLKQPEYVHVLLNPIPVYAMACGAITLLVSLILRSRPAQVVGLLTITVAALSAWPVAEYGEHASDRVYSMSNKEAQEWLDVHMHRADIGVWVYYAAAAVAILAWIVPRFRPKSQTPLALVALLFGIAALFAGAWISHAGGKVRHSEFRSGPPPAPVPHEEEH